MARMNTIWRSRNSKKLWLAVAVLAIPLGACVADDDRAASRPRETILDGSAAGGYLAARYAERTRDYDVAARFLMQALEDEPDNFDLLIRAHAALIAAGRFDDAIKIAQRILQVSQGNPSAQFTLAIDDVRHGQYASATSRLESVPISGVSRIVVPLMNGWVVAAQGRPAAALNALRPINEVEGFRPLFEYHAALISDFADRPAEAEEHFRRAIEGNGPAAGRLVSSAGAFLERQGRPDEATAIYAQHQFQRDTANDAPARVTSAAAGIAEGLFDVASALRQENSQQLTLTYARLALGLVPDMPDALLLVGELLDAQGQRMQALALYEKISPQSSAGWQARLRIAETLHAQGRTDEAISRLDAMARERPDRLDPLIAKGQMLRVRERFSEAVAAYDVAVQRIDKIERRHWALFYARGIALERAKQWPRAEADFRRALELEPDQPDVLNYLAYSWVDQGVNFEPAREMLDRAVSLRPNSGHIVDSLGWVLYRTGKFQEAVPVLERAVELQPEDPVLLDHLGDAYWRVGRVLEASFQWRRALGNKPDAELKASLERKLQGGIPTATSERRS